MELFSTAQAAKYLGGTKRQVSYHYVEGNLVGQKVGRNLVFTKQALDEFKPRLSAVSRGGKPKVDFSSVRHLIGRVPDRVISEQLNCNTVTVARYRKGLGMPPAKDRITSTPATPQSPHEES